jgi:hypothetical protein
MANLRKWTVEERDTALLVLAATGGNANRASKILRQQGITIAPRTLLSWKTIQHPDRYAELQAERMPEIEAIATARMLETILKTQDAQDEAVDAAQAQVRAGDAKDPSAVARNLAVVLGINNQHRLALSGRPTSIVAHESGEDVLKRLGDKYPGLIVESTAEEVTAEQPMLRAKSEVRMSAPD